MTSQIQQLGETDLSLSTAYSDHFTKRLEMVTNGYLTPVTKTNWFISSSLDL
nr:hypothetical protein [Nostoc sp. ChiSLP03a]